MKIPLFYRRKNRNPPLSVSLVAGNVELMLDDDLLQRIGRIVEKNVNVEDQRLKIDDSATMDLFWPTHQLDSD